MAKVKRIIVTERNLPKEDGSKHTAHELWCGIAHPTREDRKAWPRISMTVKRALATYADLSACGLCKTALEA